MTICNTFKRFLSRSNKKSNESFENLISEDFWNPNRSFDELKNKCTKMTENLLTKISSLTQEQARVKYEESRKDLQTLKEHTPPMLHGVKDFTKKYEFLYHSIEKYRDELKKKVDNPSE